MLNPFFLQGSKSEQGLIQDLINEQLRMYGVEVYYLPRQYVTEKTIIREVIESTFSSAYPIEAYVETYEGYNDNPTILSKFGIQAQNEITLVISRERFKTYISPLIKNIDDVKLYTRPKEGDLVYFPFGKRLFEIKYVEHEKPFYQLQGLYTYQLRCELFRYEDEKINTSVEEIDDLVSGTGFYDDDSNNEVPMEFKNVLVGNITTLTMVGTAVTASAVATVVNGGISSVTILNRGGGYTYPPTVGFSSAPEGGTTASATVKLIGKIEYGNINLTPEKKSIQKVLFYNTGYGYTTAPGIKFFGDGSSAEAITSIGDGVVGSVTIVDSGSGYVYPPNIIFTGICSVSAAATATLTDTGSIDSILITDPGLGYEDIPLITIEDPPLQFSGSFIFNETVTGSQSNATAIVKSWDSVTKILEVSNLTGQFINGENIVGSESNASHCLKYIDVFANRDGYSDNEQIENEADQIIDFTESNPFGNP